MIDFKYSENELSIFPTLDDKNICISNEPEKLSHPQAKNEEKSYECVGISNAETQELPPDKNNFDTILQLLWKKADEQKLFRYSFRKLPSRIISEKYEFILQLNPERALKRRKPQEIQNVNQNFNPDEFNFNKVKKEEVIMALIKQEEICHAEASAKQSAGSAGKESQSVIIINVSPLEYCHILLVPFPSRNQPQTITINGLKSAVEILLLNHSCDFRVGFNSLCGYASVNHLHYHAYYLNHRLFIEHAKLKKIVGPCWEFEDTGYPAPGFIFLLQDVVNLNEFIQSCFTFISHLQVNNIAHNLYITRGSSLNIRNHFDCVRLIVWGRTSSYGAKECEAFNPALCELSGHFPVKNEVSYSTMTEEFIINELREICQTTFSQLKAQIRLLWEDNDKVACDAN